MIIVPLCQGVVAFFGFWAFGVPSPLLWAVMVVFAALIPILGSPLAWIPAALYFLANGDMGRALWHDRLRRVRDQHGRQHREADHPERAPRRST